MAGVYDTKNSDPIAKWLTITARGTRISTFTIARLVPFTIDVSLRIKWWELAVQSLILSKKKECTESEILLDTIKHFTPGYLTILLLYHLAECQFEQKKYNKSAQSLIQMQAIRNTSFGLRANYYPKSIYLLGKIYEQTDDRNLAIKNYTKFLEMWKNADEDLPELIDAKKRLANLKDAVIRK